MANEEEKFIPRNYQVELMEIAVRQNTIIYLPTGSGKTFIAMMVLKRLSESLSRPYSQGGKISFILVNSVALVDQHTKYVKDHTIFTVGGYTGEMKLDFWTREEWEAEFDKQQVFVMTSQILVNLLNNSFIDLAKINLIIFDECHRGVDDHPMRSVMIFFENCTEQPRVLGLTATLLNGNCSLGVVMSQVKSLETTYHGQVATVDGLEHVVGFSTNPKEKFKFSEPYEPSNVNKMATNLLQNLVEILMQIKLESPVNKVNLLTDNLELLEPEDVLKRLRNLVKDLIVHIEMLGTLGGYKACIAHMIQIERIKKHCQETELFTILNYVLTMMGWIKEIFKKSMSPHNDHDKIYNFSSDKVLKLFEILDEYKTVSDEEMCCLIFVQRRFTAKIIHHILENLKKVDKKFDFLKTNFVVGNQNNPFTDTRENLFISKKNKEVLNSFVNKEINVLVSSNVLEEGVDIPKCTLVIKFDKSEDYRSYIQSKGRARHKLSLYYTIVERTDAKKFFTKYQDFQKIEDQLNNLLIGKNYERSGPSQADINKMYREELILPYYVNGVNSAQVNMTSAVSLLCRYCSSLSSDPYTIYSPEWYLEKNDDYTNNNNIRVVILLPVICPLLEPIKGPFMSNKKDAKRAAALTACIMLHKCGELDNNLLPVRKFICEEDVSFLFEHYPEEKESDAGNKKKKRLHKREIADCVNDKVQAGKTLFLHIIKLSPCYKRSEDFSKATIYDMYTSSLCFGILTPKRLPELCKFPIFDSNGEIQVELQTNVKELTLSVEEISLLRDFHYLIFKDLLEILKPFLIFDDNGGNSEMLLLAPVINGTEPCIDFSIPREHKTLRNKQTEPTSSEKLNLQVSEETHMHKIVSPWYRTQSSVYVVTRVCTDKTPLSSFPNEEYSNFTRYYEEKHSVNILNTCQPLLLVKALSMRLNTFKPRGREGKRKKEQRYEELEEYLIPELVIKQDFPASLWIQARFLPTILSRTSYLLKLHQLQFQIARDIGANPKYLENCPPLALDLHLLCYEPVDMQELSKPSFDVCLSINNDYLPLESPPLLTHQYNKDFAMKMLEAEYSWRTIEEPKDIDRELDVTVMDIEHYEMFISQPVTKQNRLLETDSPIKIQNLPAITYNREFEHKSLRFLQIKFDNQSPDLCEFYTALTAAEANDIVNLERLETLGDCFLKLISSLYIIFKFPRYNEGKSTSLKGRLVSNKNLYYLAVKKKLGGIVKNSDLSPNDDWVPPCFCIPQVINNNIINREYSVNSLFDCNIPPEEQKSGILTKKTLSEMRLDEVTNDEENSYANLCNFLNKQYVSDKTMADSVEALLGAYFNKGGFEGGIKFAEWIGIFPKSEDVGNLIKSTEIDPILNKNASLHNVDFHLPQWQEFERRLGYRFKNRGFLLQALTHSSYTPNRITQSYERLEFIGDAILDFLVTCYIYEHCGYLTPGEVTDLRSALVNNNTFASLVVRCGFHKFLLMMNSKLQGQIDKFSNYLAMKNYVIDDEVLILLEDQDLNIAEYVDVPKVLGDIFESLAGAVYLDSNKNLTTVWEVFYKIMWKEIDLFSKNVPKNLIRKLFECHTAYPRFSKARELENTEKTVISLEFMCEGRKKVVHGFGSNKVMAKRAAAKIALRSLKV